LLFVTFLHRRLFCPHDFARDRRATRICRKQPIIAAC
jgi:hypothetical protein